MLDISKWNIDNIINKGDIFRETFSLKESSKIEKGLKQKEEKLLMDAYSLKLFKSICEIVCQNKGSKIICTGFLIKLNINGKELFCLMSDSYLIKKEVIDSKQLIDVTLADEKYTLKIKLDKEERFIKYDLEFGITIIEIKPEDKIKENYFLLPNLTMIDSNYINKDIYIIQNLNENNLIYSEGQILDIDNNA